MDELEALKTEVETLRNHKMKLEEDNKKYRDKLGSITSVFGEDPVTAIQSQREAAKQAELVAQKIHVAALETLVKTPVHPELSEYALEFLKKQAKYNPEAQKVEGINEAMTQFTQSKLHQILSGSASSPEPAKPQLTSAKPDPVSDDVKSLKDLYTRGSAFVNAFKQEHPEKYARLEAESRMPITKPKLSSVPFAPMNQSTVLNRVK